MNLKELLIEDLNLLISKENHIISEESMQLLIHLNYKKLSKEKNESIRKAKIIHINNIQKELNQIHQAKLNQNFQFLVEFNTRSLAFQNTPSHENIFIHYAAMDVYNFENGEMLVFLADHYFGKEFRYVIDDEKVLGEYNFPIYFVIAGGHAYQNDSSHCSIFSLQHLLQSACDTDLKKQLYDAIQPIKLPKFELKWLKNESELPEQLDDTSIYFSGSARKKINYRLGALHGEFAKDCLTKHRNFNENLLETHYYQIINLIRTNQHIQPNKIKLNWNQLKPNYNFYLQSWNSILSYVNYTKTNDVNGTLNDFEPSPTLIDYHYDTILGNNIIEYNENSFIKIRNYGIHHLSIAYATEAINNLENDKDLEHNLIEICYKTRYPLISELLTHQFELKKDIEQFLEKELTEHQFSYENLFFSNQWLINSFSNTSSSDSDTLKLNSFLKNYNLSYLVLLQKIDIQNLLTSFCFNKNNQTKIDPKTILTIENNIGFLDLVLTHILSEQPFILTSQEIIDLMSEPNTLELCEILPFRRLLFFGHLIDKKHTINHLSHSDNKLLKTELSELNLEDLTQENNLTKVANLFQNLRTLSPVSVTDNLNADDFKVYFKPEDAKYEKASFALKTNFKTPNINYNTNQQNFFNSQNKELQTSTSNFHPFSR